MTFEARSGEPSRSSDLERGLVPGASVEVYAVLLDVVGLELASRAYPGAGPLRDVGHLRLLDAFRIGLHRSISWASEVLHHGRPAAWDGLMDGRGGLAWRPRPPLVTRRPDPVHPLKANGTVARLLVVPITRAVKEFTDGAAAALEAAFPVPGPRALELLRVGVSPGGSALVAVRVRARRRLPTRVA